MNEISELFAVEAEDLLSKGLNLEAKEVCLNGLEHYPDYPSAYSILAGIFEQNGEYPAASALIDKAVELFPFSVALKSCRSRINELILPSEDAATASQTMQEIPFLKYVQYYEADYPLQNELRATNLKLIPGIEFTALQMRKKNREEKSHVKPLSAIPPYSFEPKPEISPIENFMAEENKRQSQKQRSAQRQESDGIKQKQDTELLIVTETIAKILEEQGAYEAAIKAYNELSKSEPDKSDYYEMKISDLKLKTKK